MEVWDGLDFKCRSGGGINPRRSGGGVGRGILRELVCNSRNPDPRRVRKGGSELRPMTPFPGIPGIPRIPGIPGIEPRLQNGMPNFVRRRGS